MAWWKQWWPLSGKSINLPNTPYWDNYAQAIQQAPGRKTPISSLRFVVLDTETTGLDPQKDKILSIGAVAVQDQNIWVADRFEAFMPQGDQVRIVGQQDAIAVHGILQKHANKDQVATEILINFLSYLRGSIFVAHHAAFDFGILQTAYQQHLKGSLLNKTLDTVHLARRLDDPQGQMPIGLQAAQQYSLDQLCARYNIPIEGRHTASGDALLTAILLVKLLSRLRARGIETWGELAR